MARLTTKDVINIIDNAVGGFQLGGEGTDDDLRSAMVRYALELNDEINDREDDVDSLLAEREISGKLIGFEEGWKARAKRPVETVPA